MSLLPVSDGDGGMSDFILPLLDAASTAPAWHAPMPVLTADPPSALIPAAAAARVVVGGCHSPLAIPLGAAICTGMHECARPAASSQSTNDHDG